MVRVGVLVPHFTGPLQPPERRPIGRAALQLADEGIEVVFAARAEGGVLHGHRAVPGGWVETQAQVVAALDRYPSQTDPEGYAALLEGLDGTPVGADELASSIGGGLDLYRRWVSMNRRDGSVPPNLS